MSTLPALPYIPLEVAENIIDQLSGHTVSLRSCALICLGWNRHARHHLMASIRIRSRGDLYSICDYIVSHPPMASFVRSLSMSPATREEANQFVLEALPVTLLKQLPNLKEYSIDGHKFMSRPISFHATTLIQINTYLLVEELVLRGLHFRTSAQLARLLVALPRLRRLECEDVNINEMGPSITRFRDKCVRLSEVTVREMFKSWLVDVLVQMSLSELNVLRYYFYHMNDKADSFNLSELTHLQFLEFTSDDSIEDTFDRIVPMIAHLTPNTLRKVTISWEFTGPAWSSPQVSHPLEDAILALGKVSVAISIRGAKHNTFAFWSSLFQRYFPRLHEGTLLQVQASSGLLDGELNLGHDTEVTDITASPDGQYVATGASDGTVIVWSQMTSPAQIVLEIQCPSTQCPEELESVASLCFSDTGEFLAVSYPQNLFIWRVVDGVQITFIAVPGDEFYGMYACAWRRHISDHSTLSVLKHGINEASRSQYLSIRQVHVHHSGTVTTSEPDSFWSDTTHFLSGSIAHSSSGLFSATWTQSGCYLWRKVETTLAYKAHQLDFGHPDSYPVCANFIGDTQLVVAFIDGTIRRWDIAASPLTTAEPRGVLSLPGGDHLSIDSKSLVVTVSPQHSFLIPVSHDTTISVLRLTNTPAAQGRLGDDSGLHVVLRGHQETVIDACFSPCGRYIATASNDHTVKLWNTMDGELLWTFNWDGNRRVTHVVFSLDGRLLASADDDGTVRLQPLAMYIRDVRTPSDIV